MGIGSTHKCGVKVVKGDTCTEEQAMQYVKYDLAKSDQLLTAMIDVELNDAQYASILSFAYNCGVENFHVSTLRKKINLSDFAGASLEFAKWNKASGNVMAGLTRRRTAEKELFLS